RVVAAFKRGDPQLQAAVKGDDEIHLTSGGQYFTVFLDRVRGECRNRPGECDTQIATLVSTALDTARHMDPLNFNPDVVYPVVRREDGIKSTQALLADKPDNQFVVR